MQRFLERFLPCGTFAGPGLVTGCEGESLTGSPLNSRVAKMPWRDEVIWKLESLARCFSCFI